MNTLEVSLHATTKPTNGDITMRAQGRWGGRSFVDGILETQGRSDWVDVIHGASRRQQRNAETTAEDRCYLTQPLLGEIFQLEGGAR